MMHRMDFRRSLVVAYALAVPIVGHANDGLDLAVKSKSLVASTAPGTSAPFLARGRDPLPELLLRDERERRGARAACDHSARDLCYELGDRRLVYKPARRYMPRIDGLTPESVSLRHDRLILRYSFR